MNRHFDKAPSVPAGTVALSIVSLWLTYFALATARGWVVGLELTGPLLIRRLGVIVASIAVTAALWPVLRLLDRRALWLRIGAVLILALPASLLLAGINQWVFADIENQVVSKIGESDNLRIRRDEAGNILVDPLDPAEAAKTSDPVSANGAVAIDSTAAGEIRWRQLTDIALGRYFLLLAWAALYLALANGEQARAAEQREGEFRRAARVAELRSLRYQVNPHFLFNTLNSLSALVMTGKSDAAERMIQTLSGFYRQSLAGDPTADVALEDELALQRSYLDIEAIRFPGRLTVVVDLPDVLATCSVPGMLIQPLIENSVKYALSATRELVCITIAAREEAGHLILTVQDDGPGGPAGSGSGFGIGLANVRDRLAVRFGEEATLTSGPGVAGGWRSTIRMPVVRRG